MLRKLFAVAALACFCTVAAAQETLVVYWTKGFYPQEDKALEKQQRQEWKDRY